MREAGIVNGDTLVVERAIKPRHGHALVAVVDGVFTVKVLHQRAGQVKLNPANPTSPDIVPNNGRAVGVSGVVTACIKRFVA